MLDGMAVPVLSSRDRKTRSQPFPGPSQTANLKTDQTILVESNSIKAVRKQK